MEPITYRLNPEGPAASTYYPAVARFTDDVLTQAEGSITPLARSYRRYLAEYELEKLRSHGEYTGDPLLGMPAVLPRQPNPPPWPPGTF